MRHAKSPSAIEPAAILIVAHSASVNQLNILNVDTVTVNYSFIASASSKSSLVTLLPAKWEVRRTSTVLPLFDRLHSGW